MNHEQRTAWHAVALAVILAALLYERHNPAVRAWLARVGQDGGTAAPGRPAGAPGRGASGGGYGSSAPPAATFGAQFGAAPNVVRRNWSRG